MVSRSNRGSEAFELKPTERLAQLVLVLVTQGSFVEAKDFHEKPKGGVAGSVVAGGANDGSFKGYDHRWGSGIAVTSFSRLVASAYL